MKTSSGCTPRGLTDRVDQLLASLGSRLETVDDRPAVAPIKFEFTGTLRAQQATAVEDLVAHDLGVLVALPGAARP